MVLNSQMQRCSLRKMTRLHLRTTQTSLHVYIACSWPCKLICKNRRRSICMLLVACQSCKVVMTWALVWKGQVWREVQSEAQSLPVK
jgi:hypothetical protein